MYLLYVILIQAHITAFGKLNPRLPVGLTLCQFVVGNVQCKAAAGHIQRYTVAALNHRQSYGRWQPSGDTCNTTVPKPVPLIRPSEIRTISVTPLAREARRYTHITNFRQLPAVALWSRHSSSTGVCRYSQSAPSLLACAGSALFGPCNLLYLQILVEQAVPTVFSKRGGCWRRSSL